VLLPLLPAALAADADPESAWQRPPPAIDALLDARWAPSVLVSPDRTQVLEIERPALPPMSELAAPMLKLAGARVDPRTHGPAREYAFTGATLRPLGPAKRVARRPLELPDSPRLRNFAWSEDSRHLAFTHTTGEDIELWVGDVATGRSKKLLDDLNATRGAPCEWLPDHRSLACKVVVAGEPPAADPVPAGPRVEENLGRKTPARTYQDLLQDAHDEALFDHYFTSRVVRVDLDGQTTELVPPGVVDWFMASPDGNWLLVSTLLRPYSTSVPASRFPARFTVQPLDGSATGARLLAELPLADDVPIAFSSVRKGRRDWGWRADAPATLWTVEALDGGDAAAEAEHRDQLSLLDAPFDAEPRPLWKSTLRFGGVTWGDDHLALVSEWWYTDRRERTHTLDPADGSAKVLFDRSWQDRYGDPGEPLMVPGPHGHRVLHRDGDGRLWLAGDGHSAEGQYPFLDALDPATGKTERVWRAEDPWLEEVVAVLPDRRFLTRRESAVAPPNYVQRTAGKRRKAVEVTAFQDWAPPFAGIRKEVIRYQRADGLPLSATVYFPPGYDPAADGPLPALFWAYPSEFKSRDDAGQVTATTKSFDRPWGASHLYLLLQGVLIVDGPTLPIVGEGDVQPNDTYVEQLVSGAEAAVAAVTERGWADPARLVIGGHSYGAFTTANLLAHSDLFAAGIARSGAYNRSLTPFGFQGEERSYWEAMDTYVQMSPFTHAHKVNEPLLLIHGADDSNPGTYPVQSERMYEALKGHGAVARWVALPYEDHGYRSREAVGHTLWEMIRWVDQHAGEDVAAATR
jgi:dipeptidyl aminopeptidase/acylaminoacyl peptidase